MAAEPNTALPWYQACTSYDASLLRNYEVVDAWLQTERVREQWRLPGALVDITMRAMWRADHVHFIFGTSRSTAVDENGKLVLEETPAAEKLDKILSAFNRNVSGRAGFTFMVDGSTFATGGYGYDTGRRRNPESVYRYISFGVPQQLRVPNPVTVPVKLVILAKALAENVNRRMQTELAGYVIAPRWGFRVR